jgi:hypothetical protein
MPRKLKPLPDNPEQSKRFIKMARELEADDPAALERAFKKVAHHEPLSPKPVARRPRSSVKQGET